MSYYSQVAEVDLGNLLVNDKAPLNLMLDGENDDFGSCALECTSHFLKLFWELPTEIADSIMFTKKRIRSAIKEREFQRVPHLNEKLPNPTFRLPREKKIPTPKELTRWDKFSRLKGIQKHKKSRKVWDPVTQSWRPRWGKDRIDDLKDKWVLEVPDNADPYEDQFAKLANARKEKRAKNELQRLRNISHTVKTGQAPPIGVLTESQGSKNELTRALSIAKTSDASLGRFSQPLDSRKIVKKTEKKFNQRLKLSEVAVISKRKKSKENKVKKNEKGRSSGKNKKNKKQGSKSNQKN